MALADGLQRDQLSMLLGKGFENGRELGVTIEAIETDGGHVEWGNSRKARSLAA